MPASLILDHHCIVFDRFVVEEMASDGSFKDQGNQEYKLGNFLKAAGLYTKAIKEDAGNGVLYRCVRLFTPASVSAFCTRVPKLRTSLQE